MSPTELRAALWEAMVGRVEILHDLIVLNQRRAPIKAATRIEKLAGEITTLARASALRPKP